MSYSRKQGDRVKVRKRSPAHGLKKVHADRRLRDKQGYRKHKGNNYEL